MYICVYFHEMYMYGQIYIHGILEKNVNIVHLISYVNQRFFSQWLFII